LSFFQNVSSLKLKGRTQLRGLVARARRRTASTENRMQAWEKGKPEEAALSRGGKRDFYRKPSLLGASFASRSSHFRVSRTSEKGKREAFTEDHRSLRKIDSVSWNRKEAGVLTPNDLLNGTCLFI